MFHAKYAALALAVMFIALAFNASAQWSPGGEMVYMGDLNLAASSVSSEKAVPALGSSPTPAATNNSSLNNSSINATSMDNSTAISPVALPSVSAAESSGKEILDLSGYSRDRANKNLAGYTNIMYPISGSRGTTTSTAGGGGGCGCG